MTKENPRTNLEPVGQRRPQGAADVSSAGLLRVLCRQDARSTLGFMESPPRLFVAHWDLEPAWTGQSAVAATHSTTWRIFALLSRMRQRFGLRREAKRHAALDSPHVASKMPAFSGCIGGNPKRRRRCALPAHSTIWRNSKRCKQTAGEARQRPGTRRDFHAKSAKDAKNAKHPLRKTIHQTVSQRFVTELPFLPFASRPLRPLCEVCSA